MNPLSHFHVLLLVLDDREPLRELTYHLLQLALIWGEEEGGREGGRERGGGREGGKLRQGMVYTVNHEIHACI